jgi:Beta-galactosidase
MDKVRTFLGVLVFFWHIGCCWSYQDGASSTPKTPAIKSLPTGIYDLLPGDTVNTPYTGISTDSCWTNPNVTGVCLRTDWGKVEPAKGKFDWAFFDQGISAAAAHHKLVALTVYSGKKTPEWVYADGARKLQLTKVGRKGSRSVTMPAPWDATFLTDWQELVKEFGARYDSNPIVSYVTMTGPGRGGELYFVNSPEDLAMLQSAGGIQIWVGAAEKIASFYASAFPTTPFLYATGDPVAGPDGKKALSSVVDFCEQNWSDRFGIRSSGLRPGYPARGFVPQSPIKNKGFQMLKAFQNERAKRRMAGTLVGTLDLAAGYGGRFVEVYANDCNDAEQATVLAEADKRLKTANGRDRK